MLSICLFVFYLYWQGSPEGALVVVVVAAILSSPKYFRECSTGFVSNNVKIRICRYMKIYLLTSTY